MEFAQYLIEVKDFILQFLHPEEIIRTGGLILIIIIIFAETGLFFGFFLPGDSLLFTAGLMTAVNVIDQPVMVVVLAVIGAAIAGDWVGYWFGRKTGPALFHRKESWIFKRTYLEQAGNFYEKYGSLAIVLGRFLPIIRTFAPIVAGIVQLNYRRFMIYNTLGAIIWATSMILSGYFLGIIMPGIIHYLELVLLIILVLTTIPLIKSFLKNRRNKMEPKVVPIKTFSEEKSLSTEVKQLMKY